MSKRQEVFLGEILRSVVIDTGKFCKMETWTLEHFAYEFGSRFIYIATSCFNVSEVSSVLGECDLNDVQSSGAITS